MKIGSAFSLNGRALRLEYWLTTAVVVVAAIAVYLIAEFVFQFSIFSFESGQLSTSELLIQVSFSIGITIALMPVTLRRLHDRNRGVLAFAVYTIALLSVDAMDILSLPYFENEEFSQDLRSTVYGISGMTGLFMFVDLGCLRGTKGTNAYGPDPLTGDSADPSVFE